MSPTLKVHSFTLHDAGTYNQQYRRPLRSEWSKEARKAIQEAIAGQEPTAGLGQDGFAIEEPEVITADILAPVLDDLLCYAKSPEAEASIPNGWGAKRYRFLLILDSQDRTGMINLRLRVAGYTDRAEHSASGELDPNTVFHINSITTTRLMSRKTEGGQVPEEHLMDSAHVLVNHNYQGISNGQQLYSLRPEDVVSQIESQRIDNLLMGGFVIDARSRVTQLGSTARRLDVIPGHHASSILESWREASVHEGTDDERELLHTTAGMVEGYRASSDPFLKYLREQGNEFGLGNQFILSQLANLEGMGTPTYLRFGRESHLAGQTLAWDGNSTEVRWAATLCQSMVARMISTGVAGLIFSATNQSPAGLSVTPLHLRHVFAVSQTSPIKELISELRSILNPFSHQNSFELEMDCVVFGETRVKLRLDNGEFHHYCFPSFADALMSPLVTTDFSTLDHMAQTYNLLMQDISQQVAKAPRVS